MQRLLRDRRGGVATIGAAVGGVLCVIAAVTIDLASVSLEARRLQGAADLAALAAARDMPRAERAALATARANMDSSVGAVVSPGRYVADPAVAPALRFTEGGSAPNAVRVTLTRQAPLYFGRWVLGRETTPISRSATAALTQDEPRAMFSIGSRLMALDGGIANQLLSSLTGSSVSLTVMDYRSLADAKVNLLTFTDALAVKAGVKVGDYDSLADARIDVGEALALLRPITDSSASGALGKLSTAALGMKLRLGDLIGAEAGAKDGLRGALNARVSALDLVMAALETGSGGRQVSLATGAQTGLAGLDVRLAIGERPNKSPWLAVTRDGAPVIRTAQARLYLRARTAAAISGLAQADLPVLVELAAAEARLDRIDCKSAYPVTLGVRPGLARARIAQIDTATLNDFTRAPTATTATLLNVAGIVTVTGAADVEIASPAFRAERFTQVQIDAGHVRTTTATGPVTSLIASLIGRLQLTVHVLGLGLGLGGVTQALGAVLTPLGPVLDGVVEPILDLLGLRLGQADTQVLGISCPDGTPGTPALVG